MLTFKEFKDKSFTSKLSLREKFFRGHIFAIGQIVEDTTSKYQILDRGTNYVTVCNESGDLSKKFIESIQLSESESIFPTTELFGFKGYCPTHLSEEAVAAFTETIGKYNDGSITDAVAIIKSLKAVNNLYESFSQDQMDIAQSSLSRIGVMESHSSYMDAIKKLYNESAQVKSVDRLKVAGVIANTLGGDSAGSNPEMMVNNALRLARKNNMMVKGESMKIIQRMLELAKEVGINYDTNILPTKIDEVKQILNQDRVQPRTQSEEHKRLSEEFKKGTPVKITHEKGNTMYGLVDGVHGSVIAVKHGNNRVTFNHSHKIEKHDGKVTNPTGKTFSDVAKTMKASEDLGKEQAVEPTSGNLQAATLNPTSNTNRLQLTRKLQGL